MTHTFVHQNQSFIQNTSFYCPFDITREDVFAWRFILIENILFFDYILSETICYFLFLCFCSRKFALKLNLRRNIGLT